MWKTDRNLRLPNDWTHRRTKVLRRDNHRCKIGAPGCTTKATEVDHILRGDNHDLNNLQAVCSKCHHRKTLTEAKEARNDRLARRYRPTDRHPGTT